MIWKEMAGDGHPNWRGGKPKCECGKELSSYSSKQCKTCYAKTHSEVVSQKGKLGAAKRWAGHKKETRKKEAKAHKHIPYAVKYANPDLLAKKRFTNSRYKARKRNATGGHFFKDWVDLKSFYRNMCLCCKRQEPEILLTEDHIMPLSMGGSDDISNIQPLCNSCNTRKHARVISYLPIGIKYDLMAYPN